MFMMRKVSMKTDRVISATRNSNHTHAVLFELTDCFPHKTQLTRLCFVQNDVPLKTIDGGSTWIPLDTAPAKLTQLVQHNAAHPLGALSWSGKTLVVSGADQSAIGRQERVSLASKHSFIISMSVFSQSVTAVGPHLYQSQCVFG